MEKKYKLTEETINVANRTLYRIEALRDFANVKKGDKGGFIEKEENLSQDGNCWVYNDAVVFDNAVVYGDAKVFDKAEIYGNAMVFDDAIVYDNARIYDDVKVCGYAMVFDDAVVFDNAVVYGDAMVFDNAKIYGNAVVCDNAKVRGHCCVADNAKVCGNTKACDDVLVCDNAKVCGKAKVFGHAAICGDAVITSNSDYIVFKNWWSSGRYFTWTKSNNMWKVGCFHGTGKELIEKAYKDSEISGREYERVVKYVESIIADDGRDK